MEGKKSDLQFKNYIVNEIYFKRNEKFEANKSVEVKLNIIPDLKVENNNMIVNLVTNIFEKSEENDYPFEMKIDISGHFIAEHPEKFYHNALAILYPYVRAIVSTYTASANISPLILPPINIIATLEDKK